MMGSVALLHDGTEIDYDGYERQPIDDDTERVTFETANWGDAMDFEESRRSGFLGLFESHRDPVLESAPVDAAVVVGDTVRWFDVTDASGDPFETAVMDSFTLDLPEAER